MADKLSLKWIDGNDVVTVPGTTTSVHIYGYTESPTFDVDNPQFWTPLSVLSGLASGYCERRAVINPEFVTGTTVSSGQTVPVIKSWTDTAATRDGIVSNCMHNMALGKSVDSLFYSDATAIMFPFGTASVSNYMTTMDAAITELVSGGTYHYVDSTGAEYASTGRTAFGGVAEEAHATAAAQTETTSAISMPVSGGGDQLCTSMAVGIPVEWAKERKWMLDTLKYTQTIGHTVPRISFSYFGFAPDNISSTYGSVSASSIYTNLYSSSTEVGDLREDSHGNQGICYTLSDGKIYTSDVRIAAFVLGNEYYPDLTIDDGMCAYTDCTLPGCAPDPIWNETTDYNSAVLLNDAVGYNSITYWPQKYIHEVETLSAYPGLNSAGYLITMSRETTEDPWYDDGASWIQTLVGGTLSITGTTVNTAGVKRITGASVTLTDATLYSDQFQEGKLVTLTGSAAAGASSLFISSASQDGLTGLRLECEPIVIDTAYRLTVESGGTLYIDPSWKYIDEFNIIDGGVVYYLPSGTTDSSAIVSTHIGSRFYNYAYAASAYEASDSSFVYSSGQMPAQLQDPSVYGKAPAVATLLPHNNPTILNNGVWVAAPQTSRGMVVLTGGAILYDLNDALATVTIVSSGCKLNIMGGGVGHDKAGYGNGVYHGIDCGVVYVLSGGSCKITAPGKTSNVIVASGGTCSIDGVYEDGAYMIESSLAALADQMAIQNGATVTFPTMRAAVSGSMTNGGTGNWLLQGAACSSNSHIYLRSVLDDIFNAYAWQNTEDAEDIWYTASDESELQIGDIVYTTAQFRRRPDEAYGLSSLAYVTNIETQTTTVDDVTTTVTIITLEYVRQSSSHVVTARRYSAGDTTAQTGWAYRQTEAATDTDWTSVSYDNSRVPNGYVFSSGGSVVFSSTIESTMVRSVNLTDSSPVFYAFNNFGMMTVQGGLLQENGLTRGWNTLQPVEYADDIELDIFGLSSTWVDSGSVFICGTTVAANAVTNAHSAAGLGIPENALPADFYGTSAVIPEIRNACQFLAIKPGLGGVMNHYKDFYVRQFPTQSEIDQATSSATTT